MNLRKLLTFTGAATLAVMPVATAQNPTILQGSYVSNVFGQSNFVKNPNAQTNTANVTLTTATATRSTTTPLVATSEYNVTITSANGTAAWATRTFDAGMKNQNCEARFTYRGFQATSKAQIKQGANVVAELVLTPSATDPRIASINFPCGDLSSATTFVITDTATLAGTNEIGGIYVGLATNQANVAQAEMVGGLTSSSLSSRVVGSATVWTDLTNTSGTVTAIGKATSASTTMSVTFANLPAGEYQVIMNQPFFIYGGSGGHSCRLSILETTSGNRQVIEQSGSTGAAAGQYVSIQAQTTARFSFTTAGSRTFKVQVNNSGWTTSANGECYTESSWTGGIFVYRFPSSSELVVTPETQNVWGGVRWQNNVNFTGTSTTSIPVNGATFASPILSGKATAASSTCGLTTNDAGFCIENLPVGTYKISANLQLGVTPAVAGDYCGYDISIGSSTLSDYVVVDSISRQAGTSYQDYTNVGSGLVKITSAQKNVKVWLNYIKNATATDCLIRSNNTAPFAFPSITIEPIDNNANSALYVQGPVKAAGTGTAVSAGYQGEIITDTTSSVSGSFATGVNKKNVGVLTLTPGTWLLSANIQFQPTNSFNFNTLSISSSSTTMEADAYISPQAALAGAYNSQGALTRVVRVTTSTPYYFNVETWIPSGTANYGLMRFSAVRIGTN